jgi:hypothetical protein
MWREARRGAFPERCVLDLLDALQSGLAQRVVEQAEGSSHLFVDRQHQLPEPHRESQPPLEQKPPVATPRFLRRRHGGTRLAYATEIPQPDAGGVR